MADDFNPYAAPQAPVDPVDGPQSPAGARRPLVPASRWARFGGFVLDVGTKLAVVAPFMIGLGMAAAEGNYRIDHPADFDMAMERSSAQIGLLASGVLAALALGLNLVLLVREGQTIGKRIVGIRILRPDGSRVGAARLLGLRVVLVSVLENLPCYIGAVYFLFDSAGVFSADRRCLHDHIADTVVVEA